jgi:hypothetical protein
MKLSLCNSERALKFIMNNTISDRNNVTFPIQEDSPIIDNIISDRNNVTYSIQEDPPMIDNTISDKNKVTYSIQEDPRITNNNMSDKNNVTYSIQEDSRITNNNMSDRSNVTYSIQEDPPMIDNTISDQSNVTYFIQEDPPMIDNTISDRSNVTYSIQEDPPMIDNIIHPITSNYIFPKQEDIKIKYNQNHIKIFGLEYTRGETLCPFVDKFPFGISECECQLSFNKAKYKLEICHTINQHLYKNLNAEEEIKIVYVGLGSGALLSDLRAIKLIFENIYGIADLEIHFIDKKYDIDVFDIYEKAKWLFIMNWLHQFSLNITVYIHQQLDNYLALCDKEDERKANVVTIFDLGYSPNNVEPFDYQVFKSGLQEGCILSYLGYIKNSYYPYYDICEYKEGNFTVIKVYDARKDIKVQSRIWWRKIYSYFHYSGLTKGILFLHLTEITLLGLIIYKIRMR